MAIHRGPEDPEPLRAQPVQEERRVARAGVLAVGTLACPACDAPVAPEGAVAPAQPIVCPFCARPGAVRDFLSLEPPSRPARVVVRVRAPLARARARPPRA